MKNDCWNNGFAGFNGQLKSTVMKFLEGLLGFISGPFGVNAHMKTHIQNFFHFIVAGPPAFFIFPVHQHTASFIDRPKDWNTRHFLLGDCFVGAWYAGAGKGYIHKGVMITNDYVGFALLKMIPARDDPSYAGQDKKEGHPYFKNPEYVLRPFWLGP